MTQPVNPVGPEVTSANWRTAEFLRWSFQHVPEFLPTARVPRAGAVAGLRSALRPLVDVAVADGAGAPLRSPPWSRHLHRGFMVLHHGRVIAEEYPAGMAPGAPHALMSVTKSVVGCVAGLLAGGGVIDPAAPPATYVPELSASGYAGATVRHVLGMRSGISFSEDYLDPHSEIRRLEQCIGWSPRNQSQLASLHLRLPATLRQGSGHGGPFAYRSCEADV